MTKLTTLEQTVLDACWTAALNSTGGDFACLDEVSVKGLGRKALGGVITSLGDKQVIGVDVTFVNAGFRFNRYGQRRENKGTRVVQITFTDEFKAARLVKRCSGCDRSEERRGKTIRPIVLSGPKGLCRACIEAEADAQ